MEMVPEARRWFDSRSTSVSHWPLARVLEAKSMLTDGSFSVVLPALNQQENIGEIVASIRRDLMDAVPLVDELVVVDSGSGDKTASVAADAGARVVSREEALPRIAVRPGKGEVLWRSLLATSGAFICFVDAGLRDFETSAIPALLGPLLADPLVHLVKAAYERSFAVPAGSGTDKGGRVTELVARPMLNLHWPRLAGVVQPLSGEYAARRSLLEALPFPTGYGVDFAVLVDTLNLHGLEAIAQVDIGIRRYSHESDQALGRMSAEIMHTAMRRLGVAETGDVIDTPDRSTTFTQFERADGVFLPAVHDIPTAERPPILLIPEYRHRRTAGDVRPAATGSRLSLKEEGDRLRVGLGPETSRWTTRGGTSKILFVVHNVTSATRLLDVMPLFDGDLRVSRFVTCTGSSPFQAGVRELFTELGLPVVPWAQAKAEKFDLTVSASYGGELHKLNSILAVLSHGMGYNKILSREPGAGSREPGAGSREPGAGSREPGAGSRCSACRRSGCCTREGRLRTTPYSPTRSSSPASPCPVPKPRLQRYSPATPATTGSWKRCRIASAIARP
jgi:glucosyl-3-phosphoglycerate synthase